MGKKMFNNIYVERNIIDNPRTQYILEKLKNPSIHLIDSYTDIFQKVNKPYLQKRDGLNLFLANKKGQVVKEAPNAYGSGKEPHYYFYNNLNCIYECSYCYLQGYFKSPDLVFYINYEDIKNEMIALSKAHPKLWFHAGEFSDSLALSHITGEIPFYYELLKTIPHAKLELRTKSVNIKEILKQNPLKNIIISFSLSPDIAAKSYDLKTPSTSSRIKAMKALELGAHPLAIHFDPIIYHPQYEQQYRELLETLSEQINIQEIKYISLGVVRFTKDVYHQVQINYPEVDFLSENLVKAKDGKIRYMRPLRLTILNTVKKLCLEFGIKEEKIYLCMENEDI